MPFPDLIANIASETLLFAVPLLLVALGGMFSWRGGIRNIALDGTMIIGALVASLLTSRFSDGTWATSHQIPAMLICVSAACAAGLLFSLLLGFAAIRLRADQNITGMSLNMLAPALAVVITWSLFNKGRFILTTTSFVGNRWQRIILGNSVVDPSAASAFLRAIFRNMYITTPLAILLLVGAILLYKSRFGLRLRACGENPEAAVAAGIRVNKMRWAGVLLSGALAGLGGFAFALAAGAGLQSTVAGYGFIALAVMVMGKQKPLPIAGFALLLGFFKVIGNYAGLLPFLPSFEGIKFNSWIYNTLPYIATLILLALFPKRRRAGLPYDKGAFPQRPIRTGPPLVEWPKPQGGLYDKLLR